MAICIDVKFPGEAADDLPAAYSLVISFAACELICESCLLIQLGFSPQKPTRRALERDEEKYYGRDERDSEKYREDVRDEGLLALHPWPATHKIIADA